MTRFTDSPFAPQLEVVAMLADNQMAASIEELKKRDRLTLALRGYLREGVTIDDLSAATGLTPDEIRRRVDGELNILSDAAELSGSV